MADDTRVQEARAAYHAALVAWREAAHRSRQQSESATAAHLDSERAKDAYRKALHVYECLIVGEDA